MDIVDINKVLDDLEFNEEQHSKSAKTPAINEIRSNKPQPDLHASYTYASTTSPAPAPSTGIAAPMPSVAGRMPKTNFVKVSNVFNSLSEYMNAGIEAVKIADECEPHNPTPLNPTLHTNLSNSTSVRTHYDGPSHYHPNEVAIPGVGYSNEQSETNTEQRISSMHIPLSPPSYEESQMMHASSQIVSDPVDSSINELDDSSTSSSDGAESENSDEKLSDAETGEGTINDTSCMRTDLSSIVPPTSISLEITASHETDTALPETTKEESSEVIVNDEVEDQDEVVMKNHDEESHQLNDKDSRKDDNEMVQNNNRLDNVPESNDEFVKPTPIPITFETAATMDDVSDTELESYLQELEDLEEQSLDVKTKSDSVKSVNGSVKSDDIEACDAVYNIYQTIESTSEVQQILTRDDRNADSFSQASAVEFGEVNATSVNEPSMNQNSDRNAESVSDLEPETEVDPEPTVEISENQHEQIQQDVQNEATSNVHTESTVEMDENATEQNQESSDMQHPTECSECEQDQQMNSTAKRPNSLNLQNCNPTFVESQENPASNSALNFSSDDNAGNTPSACGQYLSSPISSDDSNITTDNNHSVLENSQFNMDSESANESNTSENYSNVNQSPVPHLSSTANISIQQIGKTAPYWVPDNMTVFCMQCNQKFSFIKRRHHCRACGLVLCSACCSLKAKLEYLGDVEARISIQCDILLNRNRDSNQNIDGSQSNDASGLETASVINSPYGDMSPSMARSPNPNNPMEYCSVIPPHQQVASSAVAPISVMVPVGVLKREGAPPKSQRKEKNVMFSDGIRPGCDLTDLDTWDPRPSSRGELCSPPGPEPQKSKMNNNLKLPSLDPKTNSYIPPSPLSNSTPDTKLPPICVSTRTEFKYAEVNNNQQLIERLQMQQLKFMIQRNFYVLVKIVKLTCCINKVVINFTTQGMHLVGQDEIVILLELDSSNLLPKDIFIHLNEIYRDADKGQAITELGFSVASSTPFLGSKEHGGFLFIRTTFQCMQNIIIPENPYLIGILIHRWEVPWAKIFPLRLMLRLGALHRYYPSPHVSVRGRNSVYAEIAQTIINFLADFRTYSYTIPTIRGMFIHMEDRRTNVLIPRNRYDQVMKALNNSSDHIFALAGNFSEMADGHLVCVQNTESGCAETHAYSTQAINIQGKPRKVTGASFLVLNGALKTTSGLSGKCSIVEDGLMVQILPKKMAAVQQALKTMKDIDIVCGPVDGDESQTELVSIQWVENDTYFNVGVISPIDKKPMDGIPSIRVHHGSSIANSNHIIRWTEVFILKSDDESAHGKDPIDMSKLSEQIARSASVALVSFLDLLATNNMTKLAIRATLDQHQVCYEAGSNFDKLAPLYMNALDNELIPTLHRQATNLQLD